MWQQLIEHEIEDEDEDGEVEYFDIDYIDDYKSRYYANRPVTPEDGYGWIDAAALRQINKGQQSTQNDGQNF